MSRRAMLLSALGLGASALTGCAVSEPRPSAPTPPASTPSTPSPTADPTPTPSPTPTWTDPLPAGPFTVLLLGTDTWEDPTTGRPDAIVLAQLSADRSHLALVSVARDSWVPIDGGREGKINAGYGGDVEKMRRTVSDLLGGLPIHATALTGFAGYTAIVRALGTFEVENAIESTFVDPNNGRVSHFPAGTITLSPEDWLVYARQRKELPRGDLDRAARHRAILLGIGRRLRGLAASDPAGMAGVAGPVAQHVRFTGGLTPEAALGLAPLASGFDMDAVTSLLVPVAGFGTRGGQSVTLVDRDKTAQLAAALASGDVRAYAAEHAGDAARR